MTINMLPDDVLLEIFHWYLDEDPSYPNPEELEEWQTLVHVCRKWRNVVLGSPRRLNLQLLYDGRRPVKEMLDVWPPFPIAIYVSKSEVVKISPRHSNTSSTRRYFEFGFEERLGGDAGAIPSTETPADSFRI